MLEFNPMAHVTLSDTYFSLALHPEKTLVASGQTGKAPFICVWDTYSMEMVSILKDGHQNGVGALGFDKEGKCKLSNRDRLAGVGFGV